MGAQEAPAGKRSLKGPGTKIDADALKQDVKAFASQLGLVTGAGGDHAFSEFAPSKAKQKLAPESKPNKRQRLNDDAPVKNKGAVKGAAAQRQQPPSQTANGSNNVPEHKEAKKREKAFRREDSHTTQHEGEPSVAKGAPANGSGLDRRQAAGDAKAREWNFGIGPRPGEVKGFKSLLGKAEASIWYRAAEALESSTAAVPQENPTAGASAIDPDLFELRRAAAESLMDAEAAAFERELMKRNSSDFKWLQQVRRAGTSTDKLAAATLLVQESVVANMKALDQLIGLATKRSGGKELVRQAMEALQELLMNVLLPNRKLKFLEQQPLKDLPPGRDGDKLLLLWWTEDCVKRRYAMFVAALEEHSKDNLDFLKEKSMRLMGELLAAKPECEAQLLAALVNKLGDPSRQVSSKAVYQLMQLLARHPVMKPVVVREVERFVFRPGLADKARYYAVVFLIQVPLSHRASEGGEALARQLINVYLTMFRMVVEGQMGMVVELRKKQELKYEEERKKFKREQRWGGAGKRGGRGGRRGRGGRGGKPSRPPPPPKFAVAEEVDARLLSGLITGVRRAFPYVKPEDVEPLVEQSANQFFRLVHTAPFTVAVQALMLMYQLMSARAAINERYYRALYAALDREGPTTSARAPMFLALVFKAMKDDVSLKRLAAFSKRLLQLASSAQPNWACGALLLISQVLASHPALWASITHPEDVGSSGVEVFKDPDDPDDELFEDYDEGEKHVGDGKKFVPVKGGKKVAGITMNGSQKATSLSEDREDKDGDAELAGLELDLSGTRQRTHALASTSGRATGVAAAPRVDGGAGAGHAATWPQTGYYEMEKREPLYANADRSCWWELTLLAAHVHPSVSAMARALLCGAPVVFDGDPLRDLSLVAFLDKFVSKKPKLVVRGASVMQPSSVPLGGLLEHNKPLQRQHTSLAQLSSEAFAALAEVQVDSADVFFHKFLNLREVKAKQTARADAKAKKSKESGEEEYGAAATGSEDSMSEADDEEVDDFLEKQEGMGLGDSMGLGDMGYDYDKLVASMEEDVLSDPQDPKDEEMDGSNSKGGSVCEDEGTEDSLEDMNILDLPSPSDRDEAEDESDAIAAAARYKRYREAMASAGITKADLQALSSDEDVEEGEEGDSDGGEEEGSEGDGEDELMRLMAEGSDVEEQEGVDADAIVSGSDDEARSQLASLGVKRGKKDKKGARGGKGASLFASADDYQALIEQAEQVEDRNGAAKVLDNGLIQGRGRRGGIGIEGRGGRAGTTGGGGRMGRQKRGAPRGRGGRRKGT